MVVTARCRPFQNKSLKRSIVKPANHTISECFTRKEAAAIGLTLRFVFMEKVRYSTVELLFTGHTRELCNQMYLDN